MTMMYQHLRVRPIPQPLSPTFGEASISGLGLSAAFSHDSTQNLDKDKSKGRCKYKRKKGKKVKKPSLASNCSASASSLPTMPQRLRAVSTNKNAKRRILVNPDNKSNWKSLCVISTIGVLFLILHITIISLSIEHFDKYDKICSNPDAETVENFLNYYIG